VNGKRRGFGPASFFLIRLDLGGSPAGYSDDCLANSPKLKVLCMMRLAGGEGGSIPPRGSFFYIRGACMIPMVMAAMGLNKPDHNKVQEPVEDSPVAW
jgi:hypothetical protein